MAAPAMAKKSHHHTGQHGQGGQNGPVASHTAPEIDPGSMLGGMTLLIGGAFILADRRCRSKPQVRLN
jgi:hypothetical protein